MAGPNNWNFCSSVVAQVFCAGLSCQLRALDGPVYMVCVCVAWVTDVGKLRTVVGAVKLEVVVGELVSWKWKVKD